MGKVCALEPQTRATLIKFKSIHKLLGWLLALPLLAWATTGVVFLTKPGYDEAYEQISIKTHPLDPAVTVNAEPGWNQIKLVHSILGHHLLVKTDAQTMHLKPRTGEKKAFPTEAEIAQLVTDATAHNVERYGAVVNVEFLEKGAGQYPLIQVTTDTGVHVTLDWASLSLSQSGNDTRLIQNLYRIHYLQWWPADSANTAFAVGGLVVLVCLTLLGLLLSIKQPDQAKYRQQ